MRLRLPELLAEKGWSVYQFAQKAQEHGINERQAYRLAAGTIKQVPLTTLEILAVIFDVRDVGGLLVREKSSKRRS